MIDVSRKLERTRDFMGETVWHDPPGAGRIHMFLLYSLRVLLITFGGLRNQMLLLRASALCYSTLLAIVPVFAIGLSMLKGLGIEGQIEETLLKYLTAEQGEIAQQITAYIANTDFKALGAMGTAFLIVAVIMMLSNVEGTFNDIWGVTRSRSILRKITDYISVLILGPLLIVISTAFLSALTGNMILQMLAQYPVLGEVIFSLQFFLSYAGLWIAFTAIYLLMPNTRVRFLPALVAGVVCGSLWEFAFVIYTEFYVGVVSYNKIYGTFAVLPIFIIWLFISWIIVLIGAQMTNAIQHIKTYQQERQEFTTSTEEREILAFYLMAHIASGFANGSPPLGVEQLSNELSMPVRIVRETLDELAASGLLREVINGDQVYQPARDLSLIGLSEIHDSLRRSGAYDWRLPERARHEKLDRLLEQLQFETARHLESKTLRDLV